MARLSPLEPCIPAADIYPPEAAFMARTTLAEAYGVGYTNMNLDGVTLLLAGVLGDRATVRHASGTTDEILAFLSEAGLTITEAMRRYREKAEADQHARELVARGHKLFWAFPAALDVCGDEGHLVSPSLWRELNAKKNLHMLAPAGNILPQQVLGIGSAAGVAFSRPVFVKAAGGISTGAGYMVRFCDSPQAYAEACAWFAEQPGVDELLVETAAAIRSSWCVSIVVQQDGVQDVAAVEQLFSAPGKQSGSIVDPVNAIPQEGLALARAIGEAGRQRGFRGLAGIDVGLSQDGRIYAFDPNFRFAASASQALLHGAAARRSGLSTSISINDGVATAMPELLSRLRGPMQDGWFIPTRLIDGALLPAANGKCMYTGFVMARDRADALSRLASLKAIAAGLQPGP